VEAARAVVDWARNERGLTRIAAITALDNAASGAVLTKAGFRDAGLVTPPAQGPSRLYVWGDREVAA
jgi:RimJ/RimL family protein N-acetyltransferase